MCVGPLCYGHRLSSVLVCVVFVAVLDNADCVGR